MGRQSKNLSNAFEKLGKSASTEENNILTENDTVNVTVLRNTEDEYNEAKPSSTDDKAKTVKEVNAGLMQAYKEKSQKKKIEDTHTRATFLFKNDLAKRLDKLSKNKRGFKTLFINTAIETLLDEWEQEEK